jgi:hypothetical protein
MAIDTLSDKNIFPCRKCERIIKDICDLMKPGEALWFQKCIAEIREHDGHLICVRFLRLFRCGLIASKAASGMEAS